MRRTNLRITLGTNDRVLQGDIQVHEDGVLEFELVVAAWDLHLHIDAMAHELLAQYFRWNAGELPGQKQLPYG